jgi:peptidoglycan/LPS O-acetylase OafA/YrhL
MDAIAMGCLTALIVAGRRFSPRTLRILAAAGIAILVVSLCFSLRIKTDQMTILALGACMVIAAAAQTQWRSPRLLRPLAILGERSYEVYLTHMFVVFVFFDLFVFVGKPMRAVPLLFVAVILVASVLGALVARLYSEPMNQILREGAIAKIEVPTPQALASRLL